MLEKHYIQKGGFSLCSRRVLINLALTVELSMTFWVLFSVMHPHSKSVAFNKAIDLPR